MRGVMGVRGVRLAALAFGLALATGVATVAALPASASPASAVLPASAPAPADGEPGWWEKGLSFDYPGCASHAGELCFPLVNMAGPDEWTVGDGGGELYDEVLGSLSPRESRMSALDWTMLTDAGSPDFRLRNLWDGGCLDDTWRGVRITDSGCEPGDRDSTWHLIPVNGHGRPGQYMLQNGAGKCLGGLTLNPMGLARIANCNADNENFWWEPKTRAQASVWAEFALRHVQRTCLTAGVSNGSCVFDPAPGALEAQPEIVERCTDPVDVFRNDTALSLDHVSAAVPAGAGAKAEARAPSAKPYGLDVPEVPSIHAAWVGSVAPAYSARWESLLLSGDTSSASRPHTVAVPPGSTAWSFLRTVTGRVDGSYVFGARTEWEFRVPGVLQVPVGSGSEAVMRVTGVAPSAAVASAESPCMIGWSAEGGGADRGGASDGSAGSAASVGSGSEPDSEPTEIDVRAAADRASTPSRPLALTVRVFADRIGVAGEVVLIEVRDGEEVALGRVPITGRATRSDATTTVIVPADLAPGTHELVVRFVSAVPASIPGAEATIAVTVEDAAGA